MTSDDVLRHTAFLRRLAREITRHDAEAEDLVQESWLAALASPPKDRRALPAWLRTVLVRVAGRRRYAERRRSEREKLAAAPEAVEARADRQEQLEVLVKALRRLPEPSREILFLRCFDELEFAEIARRLDLDVEAVRSRYRRAVGELADRFDRGGERAWFAALALPLRALRGTCARVSASGASAAGGVVAVKLKAAAAVLAVAALVTWLTWPRRNDAVAHRPYSLIAEASSAAAADPAAMPSEAAHSVVTAPIVDRGAEPLPRADAPAPAPVAISGRVVEESRVPVPNCRVLVHCMGRPSFETRTDADGAFAIEVPRSTEGQHLHGGLHVVSPDGARAVLRGWDSAGPLKPATLGVLVLEDAAPLRIQAVVAGMGRAQTEVSLSSDQAYFGTRTTGADGAATWEPLPKVEVDVRAEAPAVPLSLLGHARAKLPLRGETLVMELAPDAPFEVRVTDKATGAPIPGALVEMLTRHRPFAGTKADANGVAVLFGRHPGEETILRASARGFRSSGGGGWTVRVPAGALRATIELEPAEPFSWEIRARDGERPPDGTVVRLRNLQAAGSAAIPEVAQVEGGRLVVRDLQQPQMNAIAELPDGRVAFLRVMFTLRETLVTFTTPRRLEVKLKAPDGRPLAGEKLIAYAMAKSIFVGTRTTDEAGRATWERIPGLELTVARRQVERTFDLSAGDVVAEVIAATPIVHAAVVRCRERGELRLPPKFQVNPRNGELGPVREDPERAEIAFSITAHDPALPVSFELRVPDRSPFEAEMSGAPGGMPAVYDYEATAGIEVGLRVMPPTDGFLRIVLGRWNDAESKWSDAWVHLKAIEPPREYRAVGLRPGQYRLSDATSGLMTPFTVEEGRSATEVSLDLSRVRAVRGRVMDDGGAPVSGASVETVQGGAVVRSWPCAADGSFTMRVPGGSGVTIRAEHPLLRSGVRSALAEADGRDDYLLVLERGPVVSFRTDPTIEKPAGVQVRVFRSGESGAPMQAANALEEGGVHRIGGLAPGTHDLWLETSRFAPVFIPKVAVGDDGADLGVVPFGPGSSLRVRLGSRAGSLGTTLQIECRALDGPEYVRVGSVTPGSTGTVTGLGPGRFRLTLRAGWPSVTFHEQTVSLDGRSDLAIDIPAR